MLGLVQTIRKLSTTQVLIAICLALVILISVSEAFYQTPLECKSKEFHATYAFTLDDLSGPCTYMQRVTSSLTVYFVEPFALFWPVTLALLVILFASAVRHKGLRSADWCLLSAGLCVLLGFSLLAYCFFTIVNAL